MSRGDDPSQCQYVPETHSGQADPHRDEGGVEAVGSIIV